MSRIAPFTGFYSRSLQMQVRSDTVTCKEIRQWISGMLLSAIGVGTIGAHTAQEPCKKWPLFRNYV